MECSNCSSARPIEDQGTLLFVSSQLIPLNKITQLFTNSRIFTVDSNQVFDDGQPHTVTNGVNYFIPISYLSREELLNGLKSVYDKLTSSEQLDIHIEIDESNWSLAPTKSKAVALPQFFARMKHHNLVTMMTNGQFTSHMQPIIDMQSQRVFGYEFLLRPSAGQAAFNPFELFSVAQQTGLHSFLDRAARISAIQTSALHLPQGIKRFVNFLPSSIYNPNYCLSHTFKAIEDNKLDPRDFVFEVVETERIEDIGHLKKIFAIYQKQGMQVALDDVGTGFATLEVLPELAPDFVKIDRGLIDNCDQDENKQQQIIRIIEISHSFGATVLAEGMERKEEWDFCKKHGIELAQGYLLGRPAALPLGTASIEI
ncbi:EAL domain-containing protein [Paenibacillus agricola]|uniref:EAL domain-containing protein n=1 Tax=Paenibacillus agricola TaxID=2716264 RepID=A0ABX0JJU6_9BACL|nr:EAL domain-containing protein [Paenibacillus agricola]NHN35367.1 EAL domain-containing protein [Paenibacillus agricola]